MSEETSEGKRDASPLESVSDVKSTFEIVKVEYSLELTYV